MTTRILASNLTIIGPGRAGRALARSWLAAGGSIPELIARAPDAARRAARAIGGGTPGSMARLRGVRDVLVLAVPDDAVESVARAVAEKLKCAAAFHLSGALAASALWPLQRSGAAVASLHPARVFTGSPGETWRGAFVAIEGEQAAVARGRRIVEALGAMPHEISSQSKPLYHAAATLAAGGTVGLVSLAAEAWAAAGIPRRKARAALAALSGEAASAAARRELEDAFTGAIARRDMVTISTHLEALVSRPEIFDVYVPLALETLRRTPGRGREAEIRSLLRGPKQRKSRKR